ncbi:MAG: CapA family protein [Oscillospiraceae bacterium]|nr:CapA family protein [Oscillospiraceae bacterium]
MIKNKKTTKRKKSRRTRSTKRNPVLLSFMCIIAAVAIIFPIYNIIAATGENRADIWLESFAACGFGFGANKAGSADAQSNKNTNDNDNDNGNGSGSGSGSGKSSGNSSGNGYANGAGDGNSGGSSSVGGSSDNSGSSGSGNDHSGSGGSGGSDRSSDHISDNSSGDSSDYSNGMNNGKSGQGEVNTQNGASSDPIRETAGAVYDPIRGEYTYPRSESSSGNAVDGYTDQERRRRDTVINSQWDSAIDASEDKGPIQITISAAGDCTLGFDESAQSPGNRFDAVYKQNNHDPAYFFSNVFDIFNEDDLTIVNLEGPFTESTKKADRTFNFRGDPSYVRILEEGSIEAVNLANNHSFDYGQQGYDDTVRTLQESGVKYFGYETILVMDINGVNVGIAGFYIGGVDWTSRRKMISDALDRLNAEADLKIISFHWGIEGSNVPTRFQTSLARFCIDKGADLVLGHHPHVLQGIENYNGKYAVYSLGNFSFGGNRNPPDKDTIIFQQTFEFDRKTKELTSVLEPNVIPVSVSSVKTHNDYRPTPLKGAEAEAVLARIEEYSSLIP